MAIIVPLCFVLLSRPNSPDNQYHNKPDHRDYDHHDPKPILSAEARAQIQSALQLLKADDEWLNRRYSDTGEEGERKPEDILKILPPLQAQINACPDEISDFKVALKDYYVALEQLHNYEKALLLFWQNDGSRWSKFIATVESGVSAYVKAPYNPAAKIRQDELDYQSNIIRGYIAIGNAKCNVEQLPGQKWGVTL